MSLLVHRSERGSVFFAIFAALGMAAILGVAVMSFVRGPLKTASNVNRQNVAETQMQLSAKVAALTATTSQASDGDCDSDSYVEPIPYKDPTTNPHPTGGGLLPDTMGTSKSDPWKTDYGYCVWDHGPTVDDAACGGAGQLRLPGTNAGQWETLALISAGPDRTFQTTCNAWADVNADNQPDTDLVDKPTSSDDIVFTWTYAEAAASAGGLWQLKTADPSIATISKDLEVTGGASLSGALTLTTKGLILPGDPGDNSVTGACNAANDKQLRLNMSTSPPTIEICEQALAVWSQVSGSSSGGDEIGYLERGNYRGKIATGSSHACGIKPDNSLWCWGLNSSGQTGDGTTTTPRTTAVQTGLYKDWIQVSGAASGSCGIRATGTLWCWGVNSSGQTGDGTTTTPRSSPVQVGANADWTQVSSGGNHSCGIRSNGTLWCWGINTSGQTGDGTTTSPRTSPVQTGTDTDWIQVSVGSSHSCGIRSPGSLWCWGVNTSGQVGDDTVTSPRTSPTQVGTGTDWKQVGTGSSHSCGIRSDGSLWCWGANSLGQVGDGTTTTPRKSPVQVGSSTDWAQVVGGSSFSCGLRRDGVAWCWGFNTSGQTGDGTTTSPRTSPVKTAGGTLWSAIDADAGGSFVCGMTIGGAVWCWGVNSSGQTGDTTTPRTSPVLTSSFFSRLGDFALYDETSQTVCDAAHTGSMRYNATTTKIQFCDGTSWKTVPYSSTSSPGCSFTGSYSTQTNATVTVPTGCTALFKAWGAGGGGAGDPARPGGGGGYATITVGPFGSDTTYYVSVGGGGGAGRSWCTGSSNVGGTGATGYGGGAGGVTNPTGTAGGGGAATTICTGNYCGAGGDTIVLVAGGGGGGPNVASSPGSAGFPGGLGPKIAGTAGGVGESTGAAGYAGGGGGGGYSLDGNGGGAGGIAGPAASTSGEGGGGGANYVVAGGATAIGSATSWSVSPPGNANDRNRPTNAGTGGYAGTGCVSGQNGYPGAVYYTMW